MADGDKAQFPGWPITISQDANDGRQVVGWLPELIIEGAKNPVVQVIADATGEILYTVRSLTESFKPRVYGPGKYTVKAGKDKPDAVIASGIQV